MLANKLNYGDTIGVVGVSTWNRIFTKYVYPQMEDILLEYTKEYNFPIIKCNDFGHKIVNSIIPIGANVKIENGKVKIDDEYLK